MSHCSSSRSPADSQFNLDRDATTWLSQQRLIRMEKELATSYLATSLWDTDVTGVAGTPGAGEVKQWNDDASTPIEDIKAYCTAVQQVTGLRPNVLLIGQEVWDQLSTHPDIIDRIKYSGGISNDKPVVVTRRAVAAIFELEEILVSGAVNATSEEGEAAAYDFIVGKKALLFYRPPSPGLQTPAAGYTFEWNGYLGSELGQRVTSFRMAHLKSDRIELEASFDMKLVSSALGVLFSSVVA